MASPAAQLRLMSRACRAAADGLIRDFGEVEALQTSIKGVEEFVSRADRMAEKRIIDVLHEARPNVTILTESRGWQQEDKNTPRRDTPRWDTPRWIVNPLDGTLNFFRSIPHWAISIAYEEEGVITAGVIHDVLHGEKFTAHRGDGAFLNDTRIRVNTQKDFDKLLVATGIKGGQSDSARSILTRQLAIMMNQTAGVRRFGAASLDMAWVACGRLDAFWEDDIQPWDVAAGIIIAREAGAICCDYTTTKKMDDHQLLTAKRILAVSSHQSRAVSRMLRDAQQVA